MAMNNGSNGHAAIDEVEADHAESEVIDEEKYSHKRRLTAIHNAHDRVIEVRDAVEERIIEGRLSEHHARRYYRGALESLIMQLLPVLESDALQLEKDYADGVELGTFVVEPPDDLVQFARANIERMPPGASVPQGDEVTLTGLTSILDAPSPYRRTFTISVLGRSEYEPVQKSVEAEIPRRVLDTGLKFCSEALEDAEMGLNIGEGRPRNHAGTGEGSWPWQTDAVLPHEIRDAIDSGELSRAELEALLEGEDDG